MPHLFRFFAGFCWVSNGAYLVGGALMAGADPGDMIKLGAPRLLVIVCGMIGLVFGLWLWHRQGRYFGLGTNAAFPETRSVIAAVSLFVTLIGAEYLFGTT